MAIDKALYELPQGLAGIEQAPAMEIEIEAEKPWWYLERFLMIVIPCFLLFLVELGIRKVKGKIIQ